MRDLEASAVDRLCRAEHWTKVDYKITSNIFALSENWNLGGGGGGRGGKFEVVTQRHNKSKFCFAQFPKWYTFLAPRLLTAELKTTFKQTVAYLRNDLLAF